MYPRRRVILLDDHPVMLRGMEVLLSQREGISVVGSFTTAGALMSAIVATPDLADVAIVDYSLGPQDVDCRSLLLALRRRFPELPVLVLSAQYNQLIVSAALRAGARGYLPKSASPKEIVRGLDVLCRGGTYLLEDIGASTTESGTSLPLVAITPDRLTTREREVLLGVLDGMATSEIAAKLGRAASTISTLKASGYRKLGVRNNGELFSQRHLLELD
jgi:DNA-binding NarL/FixJ family response regulator